ncbi:MAG: Fur family transcriptional regulator [Planctomycetia bacterium]
MAAKSAKSPDKHPKQSKSSDPSTSAAPLAAARACLREAGLRCTAARLAVLDHLMAATGPKTHAEVAESLSDRGFDQATIYRNLTELTESKIVSRVELGDHVWRFEIRRAHAHAEGEDHPHFLCTSCGEVSCLDDVNVAITPKPAPAKPAGGHKASAKKSGIRSVNEVLLKGQCENCSE